MHIARKRTKMAESPTTRYEQRIVRISHQLVKTPRRGYRNQRTQYAAITSRPIMDECGHADAAEMYDALLKARRNGIKRLQGGKCRALSSHPRSTAFQNFAHRRATLTQQRQSLYPTHHKSSRPTDTAGTTAQRTTKSETSR